MDFAGQRVVPQTFVVGFRFFCGFCVLQLVMPRLHLLRFVVDLLYNMLYDKSTTNRSSGVWLNVSCDATSVAVYIQINRAVLLRVGPNGRIVVSCAECKPTIGLRAEIMHVHVHCQSPQVIKLRFWGLIYKPA